MESREDIFLEEFNSKLEFSIIDGGSIRANYGDITRLMQEYSDQQSKPLLEEIERLKGLINSESVHQALRYCVKNPCKSGLDEIEDKSYIDLYYLILKNNNTSNP